MSSFPLKSKGLWRSIEASLPVRFYQRPVQHTMYGSQFSSQSEAPRLPKLQIPPGQNEAVITARLKQLISPNPELEATWTLVLDGGGIQRSFKFRTFNKTWVSAHR